MLSISKVAPVLSAVQPSWRKTAALLVTTIAAVAVVTHAVTVRQVARDSGRLKSEALQPLQPREHSA